MLTHAILVLLATGCALAAITVTSTGSTVTLTNTGVGTAQYRLRVFHHGTNTSREHVGYIGGDATLDVPLGVALVEDCNLVAVAEAGGARLLLRACGLGGSALVDCTDYEWLDEFAPLCAARNADACAAACCVLSPRCCSVERNASGRYEWAEIPAGGGDYGGSTGATPWSMLWSEGAGDDGLPDSGRIRSVAGGLRLACDPTPALGCMALAPLVLRRVIHLPACNMTTLHIDVQYSGPPAVLTLLTPAPISTPLAGGGAGWTLAALDAAVAGGDVIVEISVPVVNCTQAPFTVYGVRAVGDCGLQRIQVAQPADICGICGGNTTNVSSCAIGMYICTHTPSPPTKRAGKYWTWA
jgi:hypothetical protein